MGKYAQLVMGPAGSGKSTYCNIMRLHCENIKRTVHCVNLDPAAESFDYPVSIDIRELISVDDIMEELSYGPNGGLIYAMQFFLQNYDWFSDQLGDYEDDYLLIDCPGQIELYTHMNIMRDLASYFQRDGYSVVGVYLLDSQFLTEPSKFIAGTLMCLSAMIRLEIPHINVLSKMDLLGRKNNSDSIDAILDPDVNSLVAKLDGETRPKWKKLNAALGTLIEDYSMVSFLPLDTSNEDSIADILAHIDNAIQYGEDQDVMVPREQEEDEDPDTS